MDGDGGGADFLVRAEGALGLEREEEREAGLGEVGLVDDEFHAVVPFRVGAGVLVDGCALARLRVAGDGDVGLDVHLGEAVDILEALSR